MYFCLDIGGTSTRGALFSGDGEILARAKAGAGALSLGPETTAEKIRVIWREICLKSNGYSDIRRLENLTAGIAGFGIPGYCEKLVSSLGEFDNIQIVSDGFGGLLGATKGAPGTLIAIGTGTVGTRLFDDSTCVTASGWGFPIGDQGSGAWIGLNLLQSITKSVDGIRPDPAMSAGLSQQLAHHIGPGKADMLNWQASATPADFARLAPIVVTGAAGGDLFCQHLLGRAAGEIGELGAALLGQDPAAAERKIWLSGGLSKPMLPYLQPHSADIHWQISTEDALYGLYLLASGKVQTTGRHRFLSADPAAVADRPSG